MNIAKIFRKKSKTLKIIVLEYGVFVLVRVVFNKLRGKPALYKVGAMRTQYSNFIFDKQQKESAELDMPALISKFEYNPLISIIMPIYNAPILWLDGVIKSLQLQSYTNWELYVVDDNSKRLDVKRKIQGIAKNDKRIHLTVMEKSGGLASVINKTLQMVQGNFVMLLSHNGELADDALFWMAHEINEHPDADFIYSDECIIDYRKSKKGEVYSKSKWPMSVLLNYMYTGHFTVYNTSFLRQYGDFHSDLCEHSLALRLSVVAQNIRHVGRLLFFWRVLPCTIGDGTVYESNLAILPAPYKNGGRSVLFVMHTLGRFGAPIVLVDMVRIVLENGDYPVVLSSDDGPLRQEYSDMGVPVIIDYSFQYAHPGFAYYSRNFDLVVINTLGCGKAVSALNDSLIPVLWWIHEPASFVSAYKSILPTKISRNIRVYAVSSYCARVLQRAGLPYDFNTLIYGVPDYAVEQEIHNNQDPAIFLNIGGYFSVKGQDVLLKAIAMLDKKYVSRARFVFIGRNPNQSADFDEDLLNAAANNEHITCCETMSRTEMWEWYRKADSIIVSSREETVSAVAIEAMMLSKPVICSNQTGIADYITPNRNGFVFTSENHAILAQHIVFAIENRDKLLEMGANARKEIYEEHFTISKYANRVLKTINEVINYDK